MTNPFQNKRAALLLSLLLSLLLHSCAQTRSVKTPIHDDRRTSVVLRGWIDQKQQAPVALDYSHPAEFALGDLKFLLASVQYHEKGLLGWSDTKRVFTAEEVYRITPYLVEAFAIADADKEILFHLRSAKPGPLFSYERFTDGLMFVKDQKLNLVFANVDVRADSDIYDGNPRKYYAGGLWRLVAEEGQTLVEDEGGAHYNWIALDIESALAKKQRIDALIKQKTRRRRPAVQKQAQPPQTENWQDWELEDKIPQEPARQRPEVYFPDELPPEEKAQ